MNEEQPKISDKKFSVANEVFGVIYALIFAITAIAIVYLITNTIMECNKISSSTAIERK